MKACIQKLNQISFRKLIWMIAVTETIHNIEEAIWLPGWSKAVGVWQPKVGEVEFRFADLVITLLFYGVIYYYAKYNSLISKYLMGGALVMVLFNVFMPHLLATVITLNFAPGVISGVLLNVPVTLYLLIRGLRERIFEKKMLLIAGVGVVFISVLLLQLLFVLGRLMDGVIG